MITNVNSSLPEVYFVIYDWLGTKGILILVGISFSIKYILYKHSMSFKAHSNMFNW